MGAAILALLAGCDVGGEVIPGQVVDCFDSRDGESFTMRSENMQPVRVTLVGKPTCLTGFDDGGQYRQMCDGDEVFLKCNRRGGSP